jgi:para-nitrobenzyl esterase
MRTSALLPLTLLFAACGSTPTPSQDMSSDDGGAVADMSPAPSMGLSLSTEGGMVHGKTVGASRAFLGIPYAAPPVGALRWKPPQPAAAWSTPLEAVAVGPMCPQLQRLSAAFDDNTQEDCLTLNVWTPAVAAARPVMVFIHGGTFIAGSGGLPLYDGQHLSEAGGAVVVTINYRLGPLGFMGHAGLTVEDPNYKSSGNYGIEDQRAGLRWVKANIASFGGDPANVTVFGESAGAQSVLTHLVSKGSAGLFQRAIVESGYYITDPTQAAAEAQGAQLAAAVTCNDADPAKQVACLRGKTAKEIVLALPTSETSLGGVSWGPVVDGLNLTDQPFAQLRRGAFAHVPLLIGTNGNEGTIFLFQSTIANETDYHNLLAMLLGDAIATKVQAEYPSANYPTPKAALADALGDGLFVCPTRQVARASDAAGDPTFVYHFTHAITFIIPDLGAFHGSELPFVFNTSFAGFTPSGPEIPLSQSMMGYWTRFAASSSPEGGGAVDWPAFHTASDQHLVLDLTIAMGSGLKKAHCDFWDGILP